MVGTGPNVEPETSVGVVEQACRRRAQLGQLANYDAGKGSRRKRGRSGSRQRLRPKRLGDGCWRRSRWIPRGLFFRGRVCAWDERHRRLGGRRQRDQSGHGAGSKAPKNCGPTRGQQVSRRPFSYPGNRSFGRTCSICCRGAGMSHVARNIAPAPTATTRMTNTAKEILDTVRRIHECAGAGCPLGNRRAGAVYWQLWRAWDRLPAWPWAEVGASARFAPV